MKLKIYKTVLLFSVVLFSTSFRSPHPIKLTTSLIEYNSKTTSLDMECRVFIDDFEYSIDHMFTKNIDLSNLSEDHKKGIEDYFEKYYTITINNKNVLFRYKSSEVLDEFNVFILKFSIDISALKKEDQICVENTLFFEDFEFLQSNKMTIRFPPFFKEGYFESTINNYSLTINL